MIFKVKLGSGGSYTFDRMMVKCLIDKAEFFTLENVPD